MANDIPEYDELKLRIEHGRGDNYRVLAFSPDGGTSSGAFSAPFSELELDNFILRVGLPSRAVRGFSSSQMEEAKRFGAQLFESIMQGDIAEAYDGARSAANLHDRGLRVTLQLSGVPELMEIPWEFLYETPSFLSQSIYTPIVRSLDLKRCRMPRKVTLPLRILAMISSPEGSAALDVDSERRKLEEALGSLQRRGMVELIWLERATMAELDRVIGAPDEVHVLHYIGHGAYDERTESGILVLEDAHGHPREVTGEELSSLLIDERSLRLAVLNSCEGARTSRVDPFSGVASSLVQCGIEAVVGMQFEITDKAAIAFSERLYTTLSQGFAVDAALAQSRRAIFAAGNDIEFATPVLFLRGADARLFDVDVGSAQRDDSSTREPSPKRRPAVGLVAWIKRNRRRRPVVLIVTAIIAAVLAGAAALVIPGGSERPSDRAALHTFVGKIDSVLERSRPSFAEVNGVFAAIKQAGDGSSATMTLVEADRSLREVISNRNDLAADTRNLEAPTRLARKTRRALAASFDRSVENDRDIQRCLEAGSGGVVVNGSKCLKSTAASSIAATDAKTEFRTVYNQLRKNLGLGEKNPSF
jgi:hypothetical protein